MKRIAVVVFPGTNSEEETMRLLLAYGGDATCVHWSRARDLSGFDAFVLPGGFAYEDRIRAGVIAAHDEMMEPIASAARDGKLVLGVCNGAQILLEAGIVPGDAGSLPSAAFTHNAPAGRFVCTRVHIKLGIEPNRSPITAALPPGALLPAWAAHAQGRLAARPQTLFEIESRDELAFVYADAHGVVSDAATPNGSALHCAGLVNREGNVLALMPHPERVYPQRSALFSSFVKAVEAS
ncbi:MAG: phosphoribosylformylglycinamidine synthase I [Candidatus Tyrphobacter sp.]